MGRPKSKTEMVKLNMSLPKDLKDCLDSYLKIVGRGSIKVGAYQQFFSEAIKEFFIRKERS